MHSKMIDFRLPLLLLAALFATAPSFSPVMAATITMTANDGTTDSSFTDGTHWSDSLAPHPGGDYVVNSAWSVRTLVASGTYTFGGDSLTLNNSANLLYKGNGTTDVIVVNSLTLNGGLVENAGNYSFAFDSSSSNNIILGASGGTFQVNNRGITIAGTISGSGKLYLESARSSLVADSSDRLILAASNAFTGGTIIGATAAGALAAYTAVIAEADGAFGTGDVTVKAGLLTLQSGTTNSYIASTGRLILATGLTAGAIDLNFSGLDSVAGISLDGGTTYLAAGTYDATALNGYYGSAVFAGAGEFNVVPEPSLAALGSLAFGLLLLVRLARARPGLSSR